MTNKQIANYEFNARITNPDEPSDHELLKQLALNQASDHKLLIDLAKSVKSDHELLLQLVKKINKIEENQIKDHDLLLKVIKLNNLRTE